MTLDRRTRGQTYLDHLTRADLDLLVRAAGEAAGVGVEDVRRRPEHVERLLAAPSAYDAVFPSSDDARDALLSASPFLAFAVAIHRTRAELTDLPYVQEWTGPRQRLPVFVTEELRGFLEDPDHRLFLAQLLASFTHVAGGAVTVRRQGVVHRRRINELDLSALAGLLDLVAQSARPGVYRRMGDLALLLTGVFPDNTARTAFAPIEVDRLARALQPVEATSADELLDTLASRGAVGLLEHLGQRWYQLALETAEVRTAALAMVASVGERFVDARRILNHVTDHHLLPHRARWFPSSN